MKHVGEVRGSAAQAVPVFISKDTVYVHKDIRKVERTDEDTGMVFEEWVYDETQYTLLEYIQYQVEEQKTLQDKVDNAQLAVVELYEMMG